MNRVAFVVKGKTYTIKDVLGSNHFRWINDIKAWVYITNPGDSDSIESMRRLCSQLSSDRVQTFEDDPGNYLQYFPNLLKKKPFKVTQHVIPAPGNALGFAGQKFWGFKIMYHDRRWLQDIATTNWEKHRGKLSWHGELKEWVTRNDDLKKILEDALIEKYGNIIAQQAMDDFLFDVGQDEV